MKEKDYVSKLYFRQVHDQSKKEGLIKHYVYVMIMLQSWYYPNPSPYDISMWKISLTCVCVWWIQCIT